MQGHGHVSCLLIVQLSLPLVEEANGCSLEFHGHHDFYVHDWLKHLSLGGVEGLAEPAPCSGTECKIGGIHRVVLPVC